MERAREVITAQNLQGRELTEWKVEKADKKTDNKSRKSNEVVWITKKNHIREG